MGSEFKGKKYIERFTQRYKQKMNIKNNTRTHNEREVKYPFIYTYTSKADS